MKKILFLILIIPFIVSAQTDYLYDVLKDEADSGGVAKEYVGEHHDSFLLEPSKKIYHWYADNDDEGLEIDNKNNVIFAGFCWEIIRTTDTGGVKIIYNGTSTNNSCSTNSGYIRNESYSLSPGTVNRVGYMFNSRDQFNNNLSYYGESLDTFLFGKSVTYDNGVYTLVDTKTGPSDYHHYSCGNTSNTCSSVKYLFARFNNNEKFVVLTNGDNIKDIIDRSLLSDDVNVNNSALKNFVDNWYSANMVSYNDYIEDTIYCNDRTITDYGIFNPNGGYLGNDFVFLKFKNFVLNKDLSCTNVTDKFSMSNNKAKLTYPVGVVTASEVNLLNNDVARKQFGRMWTMTPGGISSNVAVVYIVNASGDIERIALNGEIDIKPVVSLKSGTKYISGDGSLDNPYVIKEIVYSDINVDNDNTKGTINIDDVSQIEEGTNVNFNILPKEGYLVSGISIKDSLNNDIDYTYSNSQYSFVMPNSNVTITSIYEKVKNSISVEIVNETENINIELSDLTEVEYGKEVVFKITPIKGYKVKSVIIKDENNNTINYIKRNNTYRLIMPAYDITIIPSYERVSNGVNVQDIEGTREFKIEINDASAVVYEDLVRFSIVPKKDYELQSINIIDENNNKIDYKKTDKEYEYEFVMPDTSVVITPIYKIIYRFIEGMEQVFNISKDTNLRFRSNMNYNDFINSGKIYIDKKEVDSKNYKLSEGSTIIVFSDEYSKKLSVGKHEIVTTLSDGSSCSTDFTITESLIDNPIIKKIGNPSTGDVVIILAVLLLFSGGFYRYLRIRKKDYYNKY